MNAKISNLGLVIVFTLGTNASQAYAEATSYIFTDLGTLGGTKSSALGINNLGQVVGWAQTTSGEAHATVWNGNSATDLGTLGGTSSVAYDINDRGQVVGDAQKGNGLQYATLWNGNKANNLGTLGGDESSANAINNSGQIVGWANISGNESHATLWNGTGTIDLGASYAGLSNSAEDINDSGKVAGTAALSAVVWTGTAGTELGFGGANAINDSGQVAGVYSDWGYDDIGFPRFDFGAAMWNGMTETSLGRNAEALAINNAGEVAGYLEDRAILWTEGIYRHDLNSFLAPSVINEGWVLTKASDLNDAGWIVGEALNASGSTHAFLLTPVPEPETYAMFLAGLGLLGLMRSTHKPSKSEFLQEL